MNSMLVVCKNGNFAACEYIDSLQNSGIDFDLAIIGETPSEKQINMEISRTNNLWKPKSFNELIKRVENCYSFNSLKDSELLDFLQEKNYDIGIQGGGLGLISPELFNSFNYGMLNFHPGDLPQYKGSQCPEHQIMDGKNVVCTCHLVSEELDGGDIVSKKVLDLDLNSYYHMRSSIYREVSKFLVEVIQNIASLEVFKSSLVKQNSNGNVFKYDPDLEEKIITEWETLIL